MRIRTKIMRSSTFITCFPPLLLPCCFSSLRSPIPPRRRSRTRDFSAPCRKTATATWRWSISTASRSARSAARDPRDARSCSAANSLRTAAQNAYDARQAEQLLADAQKYLDKFLKDHPDHPAAASSILSWGDSLFELGQRASPRPHGRPDQQQKAKLFAESREYFKQAGDRYAEAQKRFLARLAQLPPDETQDRPQVRGEEFRRAERAARDGTRRGASAFQDRAW